jgi:hypothetical protein
VYGGVFLRQELAKAYDEEVAACTLPGRPVPSFERALQQIASKGRASSAQTIKSLIDGIGEQTSLQGMAPIGR